MAKNIYTVELDGTQYDIEGDRPPTEQDVRSLIGTPKPQPTKAATKPSPANYKQSFMDSLLPGAVSGRGLAQVVSTPGAIKQARQTSKDQLDLSKQLIARIKKATAAGDTETADRLKKATIELINGEKADATSLATGGEGYVTGKQVVGDAARAALQIGTAGTLNTGATTGKLATADTPVVTNALQNWLQGKVGALPKGVTPESISQVIDGRPAHQKLIEEAVNADNWTAAKKLIAMIPKGDPYKAVMEQTFAEGIAKHSLGPLAEFFTNASGRFAANSAVGAGFTAANSLANDKDPGQIAKDAAGGGLASGVIGGLLEGAGALTSKALDKSGTALQKVGTETPPLNKIYKTSEKTLKYQGKTVPDIIKEKGLENATPAEAKKALTDELDTIGQKIGELHAKSKDLNAPVDLSPIAQNVNAIADSINRGKLNDATTRAQIKELRAFAKKVDGKSMPLDKAISAFRAYNKSIGGKFGKDAPAITLQTNIAARNGLLDALGEHSDKIPEFSTLNKAYSETAAALGSASKSTLKELNTPAKKAGGDLIDKFLAGGIGAGSGAAAIFNPQVGLPLLATGAVGYGAKKALENPAIANPTGRGLSKAAQVSFVNSPFGKALLKSIIGASVGSSSE